MAKPTKGSASKKQGELCRGCTKPLCDSKEQIVRVDLGKIGRRGWKASGSWGFMHRSCFLIAIGDPNAIDAIDDVA